MDATQKLKRRSAALIGLSSVLFSSVLLSSLLLSSCSPAPEQPNLVLIVLDTVRRDATGLEESERLAGGLTPHFDALTTEGTAFPKAWVTAPWTVPSHVSMFTGMLPSAHGCTSVDPRFSREVGPTLAELLAEAGYESAAFFSNPWLTDRASGLLRGFSAKHEASLQGDIEMAGETSGYQGGTRSISNVTDWLERRDPEQPFFLFVNFLEAHLPYDPPVSYRETDLADLPPDARTTIEWSKEYNAGLHPDSTVDWVTIQRLYSGDVRTADSLLGELIDLLRAQGLYDDAVVIVTSDHGENLGEHHLVGHHFSCHETLLAVPLVIHAPEALLARGVRSEPILLTDLFATLLDAAGLDSAPLPPHSRSLLALPDEAEEEEARPLFAEYTPPRALLQSLALLNPNLPARRVAPGRQTVRVGSIRLTTGTDGSILLHDLEQDPSQTSDLSEERPEAVRRLQRLISRIQASRPNRPGTPFKMDEQTKEQLRSLGYIR